MTKAPKLSTKARTRGPDYEPPVPRSLAERRRPGRPSLYEEKVTIATACFVARQGATDLEIADALGLEEISTLYRWYREYPELKQAVQAAKDEIDDRVERSLYQRAVGYKQTVEKVFSNGNRLQVVEHTPADISAQMNWLKNRRRDRWRDTREIDLVVPDTGPAPEAQDTRQLALAAIALLSDAETEALDAGPVLDMEPNSTFDEEIEDDDATTGQSPPQREARGAARREISSDYDFDRD